MGNFNRMSVVIWRLSERKNTGSSHSVRLSLFIPTFGRFGGIFCSKVDHIDLVFGLLSGSLAGLCMQDYVFVCRGYDLCYHG